MTSDDEVRRMIADVTADLRANPPKLEDIPADQRPMLAAQWQDDATQAYSDSWFAARVGELDEARRLVAEALWSDLLSRKVHSLITVPEPGPFGRW